jgi:type IV pilus assembly protein PilM
LTKNVLEPVTQLFRPQRPLWACEFTARHLIVAGVNSSRKKIAAKGISTLSDHAVNGSLLEKNIIDHGRVFEFLKELMGETGFRGHEIGVVIPDDSARISFITTETLPGSEEERAAFIRWKLKKTVPFEIETAQVAYNILGTRFNGDDKGTDLLVTLSPRSVIEEYEFLMEELGYEAGFVIPSSLAALNLFSIPAGDVLFLKIAPGCIATTIFRNGQAEFYRKVAETPLFDAIYPTLMYYQDKLGGSGLTGVTVCEYDMDMASELSELQDRLHLPVQKLGPRSIDDIFKPVLGAVDVVWANLI